MKSIKIVYVCIVRTCKWSLIENIINYVIIPVYLLCRKTFFFFLLSHICKCFCIHVGNFLFCNLINWKFGKNFDLFEKIILLNSYRKEDFPRKKTKEKSAK